MATKRFYYVGSPRSSVMHRADSITEGNRTWCGIQMWLGWKWRRGRLKKFKVCKKCERAR